LKTLTQFKTPTVAVRNAPLLLSGLLALSVSAQISRLGPLIELSRPNAVGSCNDGFDVFGTWPLDDAAEPFVAVNPTDPQNIVAAWIQGPIQNDVAAASVDGGRTWHQSPIPFTVCSGGPFLGAADPWLSFAPNGDLFASGITAATSLSDRVVSVSKSGDGGLHWGALTALYRSADPNFSPDKPSITADPIHSRLVYATWEVDSSDRNFSMFSRSTDGGQTWEPYRQIYDPGSNNFVTDHMIVVLPGGTLIMFFSEASFNNTTGLYDTTISSLRSVNHGQTWSSVVHGPSLPTFQVTDPDTGYPVVSLASPPPQFFSVAVDRASGNVYAAWEDTQFSGGQYTSATLSMSSDGGLTWSTPIPVNQTPHGIPPGNQQAFLPSVAVAADGTIGVSYYDFRFNDPQPGLPTDLWLVQCHPSRGESPTNPSSWGEEVRLTDTSFDLEKAITRFGAFFLGDYEGLTGVGNDFVSAFGQVDRDGVTSIFTRRIHRIEGNETQ
jgi:hypothetical protein